MNLQEFGKQMNMVQPLPEDDTFVSLGEIEIQEYEVEYDGKKEKKNKMVFKDGAEYACPKTVLKELVKLQNAGFSRARITRSGMKKEDTRYTVKGIIEEKAKA